jgi:hypothetical protein
MDRRRLLLGLALASAAARNALAEGASPDGLTLTLSASLAGSPVAIASGLHWRIYGVEPNADGGRALVRESTLAQPALTLPRGEYVVHVAYGLASAAQKVFLEGDARSLQLQLKAGGLRISGAIGDQRIDPARLSIDLYVPERNNPVAKLILHAQAGETIMAPEGAYHVVSTLLQPPAPGKPPSASAPTNSVASGDVKVAAGKIVDVTMRHRFANLTLKLVSAPGGEAMANSSFTVLTPGGDLIGELIGAFPSIVLAEGDYVAVARHDQKTYQAEFSVKSGQDRDVEVLAKGGT